MKKENEELGKTPISTDVGAEESPQDSYMDQLRSMRAEIEALQKQLHEEQEKATQYMNEALRSRADISNARRRLQQDMSLALQDALKPLVYQQLGVLDSFDRAFATLPKELSHFTWIEGIGMIQTQLFSTLYQVGVSPIDTQGKEFNPLEHEAVAYEETSSYAEGSITSELQRGYKLQEQVIRPALVKVARVATNEVPSSVVVTNENPQSV
jgi:molecular chaperone GrpE